MTVKTTGMVGINLPTHVVCTDDPPGLGVFNTRAMKGHVCFVVAAYVHYFEDGGTCAVYLVENADGLQSEVAVSRLRAIRPKELGELQRSDTPIAGEDA